MRDLHDNFARLIGRQPSEEDIHELYRVKDALKLENNDALWLILMALQHYRGLYSSVPFAIHKATQDALFDVKRTADTAMQVSAEAAKANLAKAVSEVAQEVATATARKRQWQWIAFANLTLACLLATMFFLGYHSGRDVGYAQRLNEAHDQAEDIKAADFWALTLDGYAARRLAEVTNIIDLVVCKKPGWRIDDNVCFPYRDGNGTLHGWRIPPLE